MRAVFATAVLLLLLHFCEVKRPKEQAGAVGSIELMVAMAIPAIATFNMNKCHWHFVFTIVTQFLSSHLSKKTQVHNIWWHFFTSIIVDCIFDLLREKIPEWTLAFASWYLVLD